MRTFALFDAKKLRIFEIYGVSTRYKDERGGESVRTFSNKREGSIFRDFVRMSLMDGP